MGSGGASRQRMRTMIGRLTFGGFAVPATFVGTGKNQKAAVHQTAKCARINIDRASEERWRHEAYSNIELETLLSILQHSSGDIVKHTPTFKRVEPEHRGRVQRLWIARHPHSDRALPLFAAYAGLAHLSGGLRCDTGN